MGTINYHKMVSERKRKDGTVQVVQIKRTDNKNRLREDSDRMSGNITVVTSDKNNLNLINSKHLEWLAWNWRAWNNQNQFKNRRVMVFQYFNYNMSYLPAPSQILMGLIQAQIHEFQKEQHKNPGGNMVQAV